MTKATTQGTEVARMLSTEQMREISDFESAVALLTKELGAEVVSAEILGDGFSLLEDKDRLIGVPLMVVSWNFADGDFGEFVAARVVAQMPNKTYDKFVIIDGGTGIYAQLKDLTARANGKPQVLTAPRGLRKSDYKFPDPKTGELKPATTHYIDTAANAR